MGDTAMHVDSIEPPAQQNLALANALPDSDSDATRMLQVMAELFAEARSVRQGFLDMEKNVATLQTDIGCMQRTAPADLTDGDFSDPIDANTQQGHASAVQTRYSSKRPNATLGKKPRTS